MQFTLGTQVHYLAWQYLHPPMIWRCQVKNYAQLLPPSPTRKFKLEGMAGTARRGNKRCPSFLLWRRILGPSARSSAMQRRLSHASCARLVMNPNAIMRQTDKTWLRTSTVRLSSAPFDTNRLPTSVTNAESRPGGFRGLDQSNAND